MELGTITSTSNTQQTNGFASLSSTEFIRVLTTELQNQDPFQPNDSAALLEQLSSIRNIEAQTMLQEQIGALVLQNQVAAASGMIGKLVQGLSVDNFRVVGVVESVHIAGDDVTLTLDSGDEVLMSRLEAVTEIAQDNPDNTNNTNGQSAVIGDVNGDGVVDIADLAIVGSQIGS